VEKGKYITVKNVRRKTKIKEYSDVTISRYINKALKNEKRKKKKDKTNGGSILFKEFLKPFEIIQIDIKYLTDIDNLKPYFENQNLVKYQITANNEVESFHWSIERDCLAWDDIYNNKSLLKCVEEYINVYVHTKIQRKGYSPYQKIKETLKVKTFKVPKPIILTYKDKQ